MLQKITVEFFSKNTVEVAKRLLGKVLIRNTEYGIMSGRIVETEAYLANEDPACHAFKGKTQRNEVMFGEAGRYYVYFIYGMYYCLNVVTGAMDVPEAVLLRAVMPIEGISQMLKNRKKFFPIERIANGPGKLTMAFDIDKNFNGKLVTNNELFLIDDGYCVKPHDIIVTTRIGINVGTQLPLRFYLSSLSKFVSKK